MLHGMSLWPKLAATAALLIVPSCGDCELPDGWVLSTTLKPPPVPVMPSPLFYAREARPGSWSWQLSTRPSQIASSPASTGTYEQMLKNVAVLSRANPRPMLLFNFADGQNCSQLNVKRERIGEVAGCSKDGPPCLEGTAQQLP